MKVDTEKDAIRHFVKYTEIPDGMLCGDYWMEYDDKPSMGDWLLLRHVDHGNRVGPLILGLVAGHTIWDQALVLEYVTEWRAWQVNSEIKMSYNGKEWYDKVFRRDKKIETIQLWTDGIDVVGHWKQKPTFLQLLSAARKVNEFRATYKPNEGLSNLIQQ